MRLRRSQADAAPADRAHALVAAAWITAAVIVAVLAIAVGLTRATASPRLCAMCHEMQPAVSTWETSAHTQVGCQSCHENPRPWYQFPQTLVARAKVLRRDLEAHMSGASIETSTTIADEICQNCHHPGREVTIPIGTLIDHTEHAERNGSCISCHLWTAHPDPDAERPLLMMDRCFTCHGRTTEAKAPGTCDVCHPPEFEKRPQSHLPSQEWQDDHGAVAKPDRQPCRMCHEPAFCDGCHGLEMPHPADWVEGKPGHSVPGTADPQACTKCHEQTLDFCDMCHHEGFVRGNSWVRQHRDIVTKRGAAFCFECHEATACIGCHLSGGLVPPPGTVAP